MSEGIIQKICNNMAVGIGESYHSQYSGDEVEQVINNLRDILVERISQLDKEYETPYGYGVIPTFRLIGDRA